MVQGIANDGTIYIDNKLGEQIFFTISGTLEEINSELAKAGWELYKNDDGQWNFRRLQEDEDEK